MECWGRGGRGERLLTYVWSVSHRAWHAAGGRDQSLILCIGETYSKRGCAIVGRKEVCNIVQVCARGVEVVWSSLQGCARGVKVLRNCVQGCIKSVKGGWNCLQGCARGVKLV